MVKSLFEEQQQEMPVTQLVFPVVEERREAMPTVQANVATLDSLTRMATEEQLERAREEGREQAFAECMKRLRDGIATERTAVTHLCTSFTKERERYFAEVEREVVKLALAVAARILQRESAMDPTLLEGVVRVAMENLGDTSGAVLCMHPDDAEAWQAAMRHSGVVVKCDDLMEQGELRLEAAGGVAELGVKAQLVEIERGFFDLLARRPA